MNTVYHKERIKLDAKNNSTTKFLMWIDFLFSFDHFWLHKRIHNNPSWAKCYISRLDLWLPAVFHSFTSCPFPGAAWWSSWPARWYCWKTLHQTHSSWLRYSRAFLASCHQEKGTRRSNWNNSINIHMVPKTLAHFSSWKDSDAQWYLQFKPTYSI